MTILGVVDFTTTSTTSTTTTRPRRRHPSRTARWKLSSSAQNRRCPFPGPKYSSAARSRRSPRFPRPRVEPCSSPHLFHRPPCRYRTTKIDKNVKTSILQTSNLFFPVVMTTERRRRRRHRHFSKRHCLSLRYQVCTIFYDSLFSFRQKFFLTLVLLTSYFCYSRFKTILCLFWVRLG